MKERGGLITFFALKGEFFREGGLIEDLWYASFFKSTISLSAGLNVTLCSVTTITKKQQQCIYLKKYKVYNTLS